MNLDLAETVVAEGMHGRRVGEFLTTVNGAKASRLFIFDYIKLEETHDPILATHYEPSDGTELKEISDELVSVSVVWDG